MARADMDYGKRVAEAIGVNIDDIEFNILRYAGTVSSAFCFNLIITVIPYPWTIT